MTALTERPKNEVSVSDSALATTIGLAAHEVPGVVGMVPVSLSEGIRRVLGVQQVDEGVVIEREEEGDAPQVDVHVVVAYGVNIPVVATAVRERITYAAKELAGVELAGVTVHVAGVTRV